MQDGTPLRAKASVKFEEAIDANLIDSEANNKSPDLTHHITVKEGDKLPLICHEVYGDCGYYLEVAAYNGLVNYRDLEPGSQLFLPPIK